MTPEQKEAREELKDMLELVDTYAGIDERPKVDALIARVFEAGEKSGKDKAVEYIKRYSRQHRSTSSRFDVHSDTLERARIS